MKEIYAPYLKIHGKQILLGETYHTVNKYENHALFTHKAGTENNVTTRYYFLDKQQAIICQRMLLLRDSVNDYFEQLNDQVDNWPTVDTTTSDAMNKLHKQLGNKSLLPDK